MGMDPDASAAVAEPSAPEIERRPASSGDVLAIFAVLWAFATLFHIWGPSGRAAGVFSEITTVAVTHVLLGVAAVAVLLRPRSVVRLTALAVLGPVSVWFEAPFLGSHWMVALFVDLGILLAVLLGRFDAVRVERLFAPVARFVLLAFYFFAAFSKFNSAFFDPSVSCGTYFFDELAASLGFHVHSMTSGGWAHLVPIGTAAIEASVFLLLLFRRTRVAGVVLGLVFHGAIALDQTHLFSDFSSVLNALFMLFLPAGFAASAVSRVRSLTSRTREAVRSIVVLGASALLLIQWIGRNRTLERVFDDGLRWAWVVVDMVVLVAVAAYLFRDRPRASDVRLRPRAALLWVVPLLVVLNGLSPYLELRTAYAFNMYSNLHTADGSSNHFLVRATVPLTDYQSDLVRIVDSSDPNLLLYARTQFAIPFLELRDYLSRHRDVTIDFVRNGRQRHLARAADDPALVEPVPSWQSKLFAFRSLDETSPSRCQPVFFPAL